MQRCGHKPAGKGMVGVAGMPASYIAHAASMDALCWHLEALG